MDNPSQYFTPKTSAVFPPGKYAISSGQLIIQNVHDLSLFGDNTVLQCKGQFGLALINITNLTISNLHFSMCGVPMFPITNFTLNETSYVAERFYDLTPIALYLAHITNLNIHNVDVRNSKGVGVLGVNLLGITSIHKAVLVNNTINCITTYWESNYFLPLSPILPSVQNITDSQFSFGSGSAPNDEFASGLNIIAEQSTYQISIYITNVTTHNNIGSTYGSMFFNIKFCLLVSIQMKRIHCTEGGTQGLALKQMSSLPDNYSFLISQTAAS